MLFLLISCLGHAQGDSSKVRLSGYLEAYYAYDLSRPENGERPYFLFNHKRHNEVGLNLGLLRADYDHDRTRASFALMAGDYPQYNLAAEPELLRAVYEAWAGVRISERRELWVDFGIMPSHLGAESAVGADNMTLTRGLAAENSPYYEAGVRLQYVPNERWMLSALVLNGWQRIRRPEGYTMPAFGTQVVHTPRKGTTINWSTFVGSDTPDSVGHWRFYNDLYASFDGPDAGLLLGVDVGLQQNGEGGLDGWITAIGVARQRFAERWWGVLRAECLLDDAGVITDELSVLGASLGVDCTVNDRTTWRIEGRLLGGPDDPFLDADLAPSPVNTAFTTALCVKL